MAIGNPITSENNFRINKFGPHQGQTLFTINNGYQIGKISVFRNGVRLTDGIDFTASDGSTVTLNTGCDLGDDVVIEVLDTFSVANVSGGGGGGPTGSAGDEVFHENEQVVTANYTLSNGKSAMSVGPVTLNAGVVVTIPASRRWVVL
tara:strand:+ start:943 stop:1386 length:444 start_codon:yes stop_codon:yes gene_type:complete